MTEARVGFDNFVEVVVFHIFINDQFLNCYWGQRYKLLYLLFIQIKV